MPKTITETHTARPVTEAQFVFYLGADNQVHVSPRLKVEVDDGRTYEAHRDYLVSDILNATQRQSLNQLFLSLYSRAVDDEGLA